MLQPSGNDQSAVAAALCRRTPKRRTSSRGRVCKRAVSGARQRLACGGKRRGQAQSAKQMLSPGEGRRASCPGIAVVRAVLRFFRVALRISYDRRDDQPMIFSAGIPRVTAIHHKATSVRKQYATSHREVGSDRLGLARRRSNFGRCDSQGQFDRGRDELGNQVDRHTDRCIDTRHRNRTSRECLASQTAGSVDAQFVGDLQDLC